MTGPSLDSFYFLKIKNQWAYFKGEHFSFWMICCYLFFEYTRPQLIFPVIDFLPWAQLFILGALVGLFLDKSISWTSSAITICVIIFSIVIFISSLTAYYPAISKKHYIDYYSWMVVFFLITHIVNTRQRYYIFLIIFLVCAAKISIGTSKSWAFRGFSFTSWGLMGPRGYFMNSGELAILMLTQFPLAFKVYDYLKDRVTKWEKLLLIIFWVTPILTILGASSRGAQLALAAQMLMMFWRSIFKVKRLVLIVGLIWVGLAILPEEQKARFQSAGDDRTSQQRLLYWQNGWQMMKDHPMLGVGFFNFTKYYAINYPQDMLYDKAEMPHNIFIQVGTDAGWLGLIPFALIILFALTTSWKASRIKDGDPFIAMSVVGVGYGLLGFTIAGQFVTVAYYPFLWIGIAFIVAGAKLIPNPKIKPKKKAP